MKLWCVILIFLAGFFLPLPAQACDSCGSTLARISADGKLSEKERPFFFDFTFEQLIWHKRDPNLAHALHHQGHDAHVKTREEFYHFSLGANLGRLSVLAELPYIVRHALDVDSHAHLGSRQRSEGFGDMKLTALGKLFRKEADYLGPLAGIKLPSGATHERDDYGVKFEPEMQPGSGSFDPYLGAAFQYTLGRFQFTGNAVYAIRTQGRQDFMFGNLFSSYLFADYDLSPESRFLNSKIGFDTVLQNERKQRNAAGPIADSGGTTWLLGPKFSVRANDTVFVFGNILFPVYQNLGGVHQKLRFVWNAGVKIAF